MDNKKIKVEFEINCGDKKVYYYNQNDKIKDACQRLAKDKNIDFKSAIFIFGGTALTKMHDEPISKYASSQYFLHILVLYETMSKNTKANPVAPSSDNNNKINSSHQIDNHKNNIGNNINNDNPSNDNSNAPNNNINNSNNNNDDNLVNNGNKPINTTVNVCGVRSKFFREFL